MTYHFHSWPLFLPMVTIASAINPTMPQAMYQLFGLAVTWWRHQIEVMPWMVNKSLTNTALDTVKQLIVHSIGPTLTHYHPDCSNFTTAQYWFELIVFKTRYYVTNFAWLDFIN